MSDVAAKRNAKLSGTKITRRNNPMIKAVSIVDIVMLVVAHANRNIEITSITTNIRR
jgi:hypothetical protein